MGYLSRIIYILTLVILSPAPLRSVGKNLGLLLTLHTLCKSEQCEPSHFKKVGSHPTSPSAGAGRAPEKSKIFWERGTHACKSGDLPNRQVDR